MSGSLKSKKIFSRMVELRRTFHQYPELAFEEEKTASIIMNELDRLEIPCEYGGIGGGVIARLENRKHSPAVALRAEMDGLPGDENTGLPFSSRNRGRMHVCGHDAHMAMVLGAAALIREKLPKGNVVFIFQPAEEKGKGARTMIDAGALKGVRAIFAGHVTRHYRVGEIMVSDGLITAQSDGFVITVKGKGGHGARPHEAVDAIVVSGLLIMAIQTLVSREINPAHPSVITIGKIEAGSAGNVIAENAVLKGSIRTTLPEVRKHIIEGLKRMAQSTGELHKASIKVETREGNPSVVNKKAFTKIARTAALNVVGQEGVVAMDHPSMGSEDFSFYLKEIPGCYVRFGARREGWGNIPLHSPSFDFDEEVLKVGAAYYDEVVRVALQEIAKGNNRGT
jgi:hippurate hydrolase